ncbi:MAG: hypothetical protein KC560_10485 [Myxococcales bacterium]|nr:hypothetical protein [Myxococcales bacterium]
MLAAFLGLAAVAPAGAISPLYAVAFPETRLDPTDMLVRIDFETGLVEEIGSLGIAARSLAAQPGTGRLLTWAAGPTEGLYEIDPATGATSLFLATTPGLEFTHLAFAPDGTLWARREVHGNPWNEGELGRIDLSTEQAAFLPVSTWIATGDIVSLAVHPSGSIWWTTSLDGLCGSRTGQFLDIALANPCGETTLRPTVAMAIDDEGRFYGVREQPIFSGFPIAIGSHHSLFVNYLTTGHPRRDAATLAVWPELAAWPPTDPASTEHYIEAESWKIYALAFVPEPTSGMLVAVGFGLLAHGFRAHPTRRARTRGRIEPAR